MGKKGRVNRRKTLTTPNQIVIWMDCVTALNTLMENFDKLSQEDQNRVAELKNEFLEMAKKLNRKGLGK